LRNGDIIFESHCFEPCESWTRDGTIIRNITQSRGLLTKSYIIDMSSS